MGEPWKKYAKAPPAAVPSGEGPWTKYAKLKDAPNEPEPGLLERAAPVVSAIARPLLEVGGAVGGGILGAGASVPTVAGVPVGAAAGGALGFAGGKSAADLLDRVMGIKKPIATIGEAIVETGHNIQDGAVSEATGLGAGAVLKGAAKAAPWVGKKIMTATYGPVGRDIEARFARNAEVRAAKPIDALAEDLPQTVNELSKKVSKLSGAALDKLSRSPKISEGAMAKDKLMKSIYEQKVSLGDGISDATAHANKVLDRYIERLGKLPKTLSEYDIGKFVRDFDNDINWGKAELEPSNHALEGLRATIDDALKANNSKYAKAMAPTAEATGILVKVRQLFNLKNDVGHGFVPGNNTVTALKGAVGDARLDSQSVLEGLKKYTGRDFLQEVTDSLTAAKFVGGKANGSRRVLAGAAMGGYVGNAMLGSPGAAAGSAVGAGIGLHLDAEGHQIAGGIIDQLARLAARPRVKMPSESFQRALGAAVVGNSKRREGR